MAFYDNRHWLISHLKNSFISSDDQGMCEAVIIDDIPRDSILFGDHDKFPGASAPDSSDDDEDYENSLGIYGESDFGAYRYRTNTAQRLAKMEQEMKKAAQIKHVKWEPPPNIRPDYDVFEQKEIKPGGPAKSLLSLQLEKCPSLPRNPFVEYAKFGGSSQISMPTRTYKVFINMLPQPERNYPLTVTVLSSVKIYQLVGCICWKYTTDNADAAFQFKEDIGHYGLYIAEDDGEVDWDFSRLDPMELVGKYGLPTLALVELAEKDVLSDTKTEEPMPAPSRRVQRTPVPVLENEDLRQIKGDLIAIEALLYQSFAVYAISKMRTRTEVVLGINGDKMEIDPVVTNIKVGTKMWRQKSASYEMDDIVFCELMDSRASGRLGFRIVRRTAIPEESPGIGSASYPRLGSSPSLTSIFKNLEFEADFKVADEVVKKVNLILHLKSSIHRKEYLTVKEKKPARRRSFSIWR